MRNKPSPFAPLLKILPQACLFPGEEDITHGPAEADGHDRAASLALQTRGNTAKNYIKWRVCKNITRNVPGVKKDRNVLGTWEKVNME